MSSSTVTAAVTFLPWAPADLLARCYSEHYLESTSWLFPSKPFRNLKTLNHLFIDFFYTGPARHSAWTLRSSPANEIKSIKATRFTTQVFGSFGDRAGVPGLLPRTQQENAFSPWLRQGAGGEGCCWSKRCEVGWDVLLGGDELREDSSPGHALGAASFGTGFQRINDRYIWLAWQRTRRYLGTYRPWHLCGNTSE